MATILTLKEEIFWGEAEIINQINFEFIKGALKLTPYEIPLLNISVF